MSYVPPFKLPFANATNTISAAGTTQGTATALTTMHSRVTTTGANSGVKLPYAVSGMQCTVINAGANPLRIYPDTGAAIDAGSANAAIIVAPSEVIGFTAYSNTSWRTDARFLIDSNRKLITQNSHGFVAGDVLRRDSGTYAKAQADTVANAVAIGIVDTVLDANTFIITESGSIYTLSGLTDGSVYYLSSSTAGALTTTRPAIATKILIATSATSGIVNLFSTEPVSEVFPAFSAHRNGVNQNYAAPTAYTKIQLTTEDFDTNSNFDNVTNYRFTPTVAGYYQLNLTVGLDAINSGKNALAAILKNGAVISQSGDQSGATANVNVHTAILAHANGSTDYFEAYIYNGDSYQQPISGGAENTRFSGIRVH